MRHLTLILSLICLNTFAATTPEQFKILKEKSESGNAQAQYELACWHAGEGITKQHEEAFKWFQKAANQGLAKAQFDVGFCYFKAIGTTYDKNLAFAWYRKAAKQGNEEAQINLEMCYYKGINKVEAYSYLLLADESDAVANGLRTKLQNELTAVENAIGRAKSREILKDIESKLANTTDKK